MRSGLKCPFQLTELRRLIADFESKVAERETEIAALTSEKRDLVERLRRVQQDNDALAAKSQAE